MSDIKPTPAPDVVEPYVAPPDLQTETVHVEPAPQDPNFTTITVTKFGEGKVSSGIHVAGEGDIFASRGDKLVVSRTIAAALETRGLAETD